MIIFHGSDHIVETPVYNGSKRTNDYGYGFYTTENVELASNQIKYNGLIQSIDQEFKNLKSVIK